MKKPALILTVIPLILWSINLLGQGYDAPAVNQRVALVIGNSDYEAGPLLNPENDARAMAAALRETGFDVMEYINLPSPAEMKRAIREFGRRIQNGGVGLFYYAGHGIQVNGKNYLVPTKAQIFAEEEVEYESVDVGFVLAQMEIARNRMNIIILDACRNNPLARSWRSGTAGLAFINAPAGTLIAYSTAPGSVASDGTGTNGLYTEELLKQMRRSGLKIEDVFKSVRTEVLIKSDSTQIPWESTSLIGDFYFIRPVTGTTENVTPKTNIEEYVPRVIESRESTEWKVLDGRYFFYLNGTDVTGNTIASTLDRDVLLYDRSTNRNYLLKDYWNIRDQGKRTAEELTSKSNAFWRINREKLFWFYIEGKDVSTEINNSFYGKDLIVFHRNSNRYFLMNGYPDAVPGKLYEATSVFSPNQTLWWADQQYYYLIVDGEQVASKTWNNWKGNDLIVHMDTIPSSYLLRDYYHSTDGVLRPAEILYSPGMITCTRDEQNRYYLYRNKDGYPMYGPAAYSGQDLLVYDTTFQQTLLFENFLGTPTQTHIIATPVYSRTGAVWRRQDNIFYLYVQGVLQTDQMVSSAYAGNGVDLEVVQNSTGITFVLKDYGRLNDNTLRPAEIKSFY